MAALKEWWRSDPKARFYIRTVVVAIAGYVVVSLQSGVADWKSFASGLATAAITAAVGLLTPVEPFVGNKAKRADVPVPPATKEVH